MTVAVSVILPTFNRAHCLPAAIASVLTQSASNLELIIVDDCSTDDTTSLIRRFEDPRVRYIRREKNGGAAAARNTGLAYASGEYIAFQDSDDIWLPSKLERQLALFASLPVTVGAVTAGKILYGRDHLFNFGPGKVAYAPPLRGRLTLEEDQLGRLLTENRISLQNALFRRNCFPEPAWFDAAAKANEDWDFAIRLAQRTTIYEDEGPVVVAFLSNDSISTSSRKECLGVLRILKKNRDILSSYPAQRFSMLYGVSAALYRNRKRRLGRRILLRSLVNYPVGIMYVAKAIVRRARRLLR